MIQPTCNIISSEEYRVKTLIKSLIRRSVSDRRLGQVRCHKRAYMAQQAHAQTDSEIYP